MVEPSNYSDLYIDTKNIIADSYITIDSHVRQIIYNNRFTPQRVVKLNRFIDILKKTKDTIDEHLNIIDEAFNDLDVSSIIYLHQLERVKNELEVVSQPEETKEPEKEPEKPEIIEELDRITEYIEKF